MYCILRKFASNFYTLKKLFFTIICLLILSNTSIFAQDKIKIIHTDFTDRNQKDIPGAAVLLAGNVQVEHNGSKIWCNKAYILENENYLKAFGDVRFNQGDTLHMNSEYAEYNGNKNFAYASGKVVMRSPDMTLSTDTIYFDRNKQEAYYNSYGTIVSGENTLKSKSGRFYANQKKYQFLTAVTLTNPKYVLKSNHLDYYTNSGHAYVFGPSTITSKENYIYTENGFYDTKKNFAHLLDNSYIKNDTQIIRGDSIYYDRNRDFSSATNNVKVTDTVNKFIAKGHYAEVYKKQDSLFLTKRAQVITLVEKDSLYTHAKQIVITGKEGERIVRGYNNARFYKVDMSGKCDSIHSSEKTGLTQLIGRPVIWNGESQLTGDVMHLISDTKTEKLDSLKVLNNAFVIQLDTISARKNPSNPNFNQVKGLNLYGKFKDNKLHIVDLIKNTEKILYNYDKEDLIGIDKSKSSKIRMIFEDNELVNAISYTTVDGTTYPEKDFPENVKKFRGFEWRGDERIKNKEDIFPPEEQELHEQIVKESEEKKKEEIKPMEVLQETLDYDKNNPKPKPPVTKE